jgi:hypothetical protein
MKSKWFRACNTRPDTHLKSWPHVESSEGFLLVWRLFFKNDCAETN